MKKKSLVCVALVLVFMLSGCSNNNFGKTGEGSSPEVDYDGTKVVLGETKLSSLYDDGFENSTIFSSGYKTTMQSKTIANDSLYLSKNNKEYGLISLLCNEGDDGVSMYPIEDCIIHRITLYLNDYIKDPEDSGDIDIKYGNVLIDGVNYKGYTSEQIKKSMKGKNLVEESEEILSYQDGDYHTTFYIGEDGKVETIELRMDVEAEIVIK